MAAASMIPCPGCGLVLPPSETALYKGYYNVSPECWEVYTRVLAAEFGNAILFGQVHQMTVDTYALQHAGAGHPDKSVAVHLVGLHLMLERGLRPTAVAPLLQRLASSVEVWPFLEPPGDLGTWTVRDVEEAGSVEGHVRAVRAWAGSLWQAWGPHHEVAADLVRKHLPQVGGPG